MKPAGIFLSLLLVSSFCFAQTITTVAGTGEPGYGGDGGSAVMAQLNGQGALAIDALGNLYINDDINIRIRKVSPSGTITTIGVTRVRRTMPTQCAIRAA